MVYGNAMSAERNFLQATIHADTRLTAQEIAAHLAQTLRGSVTGARSDLVSAERIDLDATQYDRRPPASSLDPEDAFLYFPHEIDVFTEETFDQKAVVADVWAVLGALDQLGVRYVTSADFEHELPRGGRSRT